MVDDSFEHSCNTASYANDTLLSDDTHVPSFILTPSFLSSEPINIFFGVYKTDNAPIRLSYHGRIHYNSVVDPYAATIGVGLGLAGHQPGVRNTPLFV